MIDWPSFLPLDARIDFWTIIVGILVNICCAMLGCYLVLRRMSLLGDAISHAILPGLAIGYLLTGSVGIVPMVLGGLATGMLTSFLTQSLSSLGDVPEDSSMGVVFTSLFAIGVILVSRIDKVHLDTDCVMFGQIGTVSLNTITLLGLKFPHVFATLAPMLLLTMIFVLGFWKELKIASFDPQLTQAMGFSALLVHYLLMGMVAGVTVASLEAVGAILVIAMLIVPAATAHLLTERLPWMIVIAVLIGILCSVVGCLWARATETNPAAMMAVVAGIFFTLAVLLAPRHGLLGKASQNLALSVRIQAEDLIALLYRLEESPSGDTYPARPTAKACRRSLGSGFLARVAVPWLRMRKLIQKTSTGELQLTPQGRELGQSLIRSHRLWEAYLDQNFELPPDHLHAPASRIEHFIGPELQGKLEEVLDRPSRDPHGREIPPA